MAAEDLLIFAPDPFREKTACQYYRLQVPLRCLEEQFGLKYAINRHQLSTEQLIAAHIHADINLFYLGESVQTLYVVETLRAIRGATDRKGVLHYPPIVVYDADDNRDYVHPHSATYVACGVRTYPRGEFLLPGDSVASRTADGEEIILWEDTVTPAEGVTFDIARNLRSMAARHRMIRLAHGCTAASPALASYMKDVIGAEDVYVFPNTVILKDYEQFDLAPRKNVRILWQGGQSHWIDWYPLRDAIREVAQKNPHVTFVIFGEKFHWITDVIPPAQLEFHPFVDYPAYKLKRATLQCDINLAPLADNAFNRCKSGIRFYEASIWKKPEATLAARCAPYSEEIIDGQTGLMYSTPEEFVSQLNLLIADANLRTRLGEAAKAWVLKHRTPEATIPGLFEYYQHLLGKRVREFMIETGATTGEIKRLARARGLTE